MPGKMSLHLLILCGILSQGIIGASTDDEIIFRLQDDEVAYVVYIKQDMRVTCVGNIISYYSAITSAACVSMGPEHYKVVSSEVDINGTNIHHVVEIRKRVDDPHQKPLNGVALLAVKPHFVETDVSGLAIPIPYSKPLQPGTIGKVDGWGEIHGTKISVNLKSIKVPIISHQNCVDKYRPHLKISDTNLCTSHPKGRNDHIYAGAGLIIDNLLTGIFLWSGLTGQTDPNYPNVFVSLKDAHYNKWVSDQSRSIDNHYKKINPGPIVKFN